MDVEPNDIFLIIVGWVATKLLDYIHRTISKLVMRSESKRKPRHTRKKKKRRG